MLIDRKYLKKNINPRQTDLKQSKLTYLNNQYHSHSWPAARAIMSLSECLILPTFSHTMTWGDISMKLVSGTFFGIRMTRLYKFIGIRIRRFGSYLLEG